MEIIKIAYKKWTLRNIPKDKPIMLYLEEIENGDERITLLCEGSAISIQGDITHLPLIEKMNTLYKQYLLNNIVLLPIVDYSVNQQFKEIITGVLRELGYETHIQEYSDEEDDFQECWYQSYFSNGQDTLITEPTHGYIHYHLSRTGNKKKIKVTRTKYDHKAEIVEVITKLHVSDHVIPPITPEFVYNMF